MWKNFVLIQMKSIHLFYRVYFFKIELHWLKVNIFYFKKYEKHSFKDLFLSHWYIMLSYIFFNPKKYNFIVWYNKKKLRYKNVFFQ